MVLNGQLNGILMLFSILALLGAIAWVTVEAIDYYESSQPNFRTTLKQSFFYLILIKVALHHPNSFSRIKSMLVDLRLLLMMSEEIKVIDLEKSDELRLLVLRWTFVKNTTTYDELIGAITKLRTDDLVRFIEYRQLDVLAFFINIDMRDLCFKLAEKGVDIFENGENYDGVSEGKGDRKKGLRWMDYADMLRRVLDVE